MAVVVNRRGRGREGGDGEGDTLADRPGNETDRDDAGGTSGIQEADLGVGGVQARRAKRTSWESAVVATRLMRAIMIEMERSTGLDHT